MSLSASAHAEFSRRLPFETEIVICRGADIAKLVSRDVFSDHPPRPDTVRFVSVLSRLPRSKPELPLTLPARGRWLLRILAREGRFALGMYRRHMKVVTYLGTLDRIFGVPATTRNINTISAIARVLTG